MSIQLSITPFLEDTEIRRQQAALEEKNREISEQAQKTIQEVRDASKATRSYLRASYMAFSGITRMIGGGFSRALQGMWSMLVAGIEIQQAIASATFFQPGHQVQSLIMTAILASTLVNVAALVTGQIDLSRTARGLTFALHGFGLAIDTLPSF